MLLEAGYLSWIFGSVVGRDRFYNRVSTRGTTERVMLSEIFILGTHAVCADVVLVGVGTAVSAAAVWTTVAVGVS